MAPSKVGMGPYTWAVGDRAWLIYRRLLAPFNSTQFEALATAWIRGYYRPDAVDGIPGRRRRRRLQRRHQSNSRTIETMFTFLDRPLPRNLDGDSATAECDHRLGRRTSFAVDFDPRQSSGSSGTLTECYGEGPGDPADFQAVAGKPGHDASCRGGSGAPLPGPPGPSRSPCRCWGLSCDGSLQIWAARQIEAAPPRSGVGSAVILRNAAGGGATWWLIP